MNMLLDVAGSERQAIVDDEFAHLARYRWRISPKGTVFRYGEHAIKLKHVVCGAPPKGFGITYANGDKLDNRRENLRCIPLAYVNQGRGPQKRNKSGLRGVYFDCSRSTWCAQATIAGKQFYLGSYATAEEAGAVARAFRLKHMMYTTDHQSSEGVTMEDNDDFRALIKAAMALSREGCEHAKLEPGFAEAMHLLQTEQARLELRIGFKPMPFASFELIRTDNGELVGELFKLVADQAVAH